MFPGYEGAPVFKDTLATEYEPTETVNDDSEDDEDNLDKMDPEDREARERWCPHVTSTAPSVCLNVYF